ncbi:hypothetical protein RF11_14408 [Thelohanellus kitauei]|uniref:Uncharacterized protein n=1 Tax=Thelohanellus kitauei TaxID=669202 RepID=A0A0C2JRP9_THEKT|nr:hypothetical protein RF11_14408 [Thelohanellus kitauei]
MKLNGTSTILKTVRNRWESKLSSCSITTFIRCNLLEALLRVFNKNVPLVYCLVHESKVASVSFQTKPHNTRASDSKLQYKNTFYIVSLENLALKIHDMVMSSKIRSDHSSGAS